MSARKIAMQMQRTAKAAVEYHGTGGVTIGEVRSISPVITIQPLTGSVAIPDDALGWSIFAQETVKEYLAVGDRVLMTMINTQYYVIDGLV